MTRKIEDLVCRVEAFLKRHDMKATPFGIAACRDANAVDRLRSRKGITLRRVEQIETFMERHEHRRSGGKNRTSQLPAA